MDCSHTKQYMVGEKWFCRRCGAVMEDPPERDWSDGVAPYIAPDIADHLNLSTGKRISSRRQVREMEQEGYTPRETKFLESKNIGDKLSELAEKDEAIRTKQAEEMKKFAFSKSLADVAREEIAEENRKPIRISG